ncbi:hypothetical protein RRG08_060769, partial [Elysia crispata]
WRVVHKIRHLPAYLVSFKLRGSGKLAGHVTLEVERGDGWGERGSLAGDGVGEDMQEGRKKVAVSTSTLENVPLCNHDRLTSEARTSRRTIDSVPGLSSCLATNHRQFTSIIRLSRDEP